MTRTALACLLSVAACKSEASSDGGTTGDPATAPVDDEALQEMHRRAFLALIEPATRAMQLADPIAAAGLGLGAAAPAPTGPAQRGRLGEVNDAAILEAREVDLNRLEPREQIALRTIRFTLDRTHDALARRLPARTDPTVVPAMLERLLDELRWQSLRGDCPDCAAAIGAMPAALDAFTRELTAASPAGVGAALEDVAALDARLRTFAAKDPALAAVVSLALEATARARVELERIRATLPEAPTHAWTQSPPLRASGSTVRRLPDRLGARALRRLLEVEEALSVEPSALLDATKKNLARHRAMREELVGDATARDVPRAVDRARCEAVWARLSPVLAQPGFEAASLDCARVVHDAGDEVLDDADLMLRVVDLGVIESARRAFRREQYPTVALASGAWAPRGQQSVRRIMVLGALQDRVALGRAIAQAERDLCATASALWLHAELGDDAALATWLETACPSAPPERWIEDALARPRAALTGLALASLGPEPASMVGLDMFWWAPLGLVPLLATPPGTPPPGNVAPGVESPVEDTPLRVHVEELDE